MVNDIFDALRESAKRVKVDFTDVLEHIKIMEADLAAMTDDLGRGVSDRTRQFLLDEIKNVSSSRKIHILALIESKAGIEARQIFDEVLSVAVAIIIKSL